MIKKRVLTLMFSLVMLAPLLMACKSESVDTESTGNMPPAGATYIPGSYIGTAGGFDGAEIVVNVVVNENEITAVSVTNHSETDSDYYEEVFQKLPDEILRKNSTEIDGIAGATATSTAFLTAVQAALSDARGSGAGETSGEMSTEPFTPPNPGEGGPTVIPPPAKITPVGGENSAPAESSDEEESSTPEA